MLGPHEGSRTLDRVQCLQKRQALGAPKQGVESGFRWIAGRGLAHERRSPQTPESRGPAGPWRVLTAVVVGAADLPEAADLRVNAGRLYPRVDRSRLQNGSAADFGRPSSTTYRSLEGTSPCRSQLSTCLAIDASEELCAPVSISSPGLPRP